MTGTNPHIAKAIEIFKDKGGQAAFAKEVGVTQGMVSGWLHNRYQVTWERAIKIEEVTNGMVTRHDLRPDIFGKPEDQE